MAELIIRKGTSLNLAVKCAKEIAENEGREISFNFNGVKIKINKHSTQKEIESFYSKNR